MKNKLFLLSFLGATFFANAQSVGIGTPTPDASAFLRVHVGTSITKGFLVTGTSDGSATIPNLGTGSRMMFYPGKSAFRAGYVDGTHWDNANVGAFSTAMGINTIASGDFSTASGFVTTASAYASIAIGSVAQANAVYSIAIGESVTANSWNSISLGRQNDPIVTTSNIGWNLNDPLLIVGNGSGSSDKKVQQVIPGVVKKAVHPAQYENQNEQKGRKLSDEVEFNAVNYTEMIPILIAAMKEQQVMIEELRIKSKRSINNNSRLINSNSKLMR